MPSHKTHRLVAKLLLGKEYPEVDRFLDEPYKRWGRKHRMFRHSPIEVIAKYGFTDKALAGLLHIALDFATSEMKRKLRQKRKVKKARKRPP